jgi:hypothetical protein
MMNAALPRPPGCDRYIQSRQSEARLDRVTKRIADDPTRPGIKDHSEIDKAYGDRDPR